MAGRGRGATLPAWMTSDISQTTDPGISNYPGQFEDDVRQTNPFEYNAPDRRGNGERPDRYERGDRRGSDGRERKRSRSSDRRPRRSEDRRNRDRRDRSNSPEKVWIPRKNRVSNFDVRPPEGIELPPIGVHNPSSSVPNSYYSYANNPVQNNLPTQKVDVSAANMATRHARRIYAGGIPPKATEDEILKFFNGVVRRALYPTIPRSDPVIKIYLNTEKCYAFVEFDSIELTTACMQLDGLKFDHYTGTTIIRVRRPNDYRPDMLPPSSEQIPDLNLDVLGGMGCTVSSGPGKVFIGGLPYNLADEQVKELLTAFGSIKAFHQVRDPGSVTTKGYAFCEYVDQETADAAIAGLNGLKIGDKTLNVRRATATSMPSTGPPVFNIGTSAFGMDMALPTTNPLLNIGSNPLLPYGSGVYGAGGGSTSQSSIASYPPTRVLKLSNMVSAEELEDDNEFNDIKEDVKTECSDHGEVLNVLIPRYKDGYSTGTVGYIFVEFARSSDARTAAIALNGRKFAEKIVEVTYFDEDKFSGGILI